MNRSAKEIPCSRGRRLCGRPLWSSPWVRNRCPTTIMSLPRSVEGLRAALYANSAESLEVAPCARARAVPQAAALPPAPRRAIVAPEEPQTRRNQLPARTPRCGFPSMDVRSWFTEHTAAGAAAEGARQRYEMPSEPSTGDAPPLWPHEPPRGINDIFPQSPWG